LQNILAYSNKSILDPDHRSLAELVPFNNSIVCGPDISKLDGLKFADGGWLTVAIDAGAGTE